MRDEFNSLVKQTRDEFHEALKPWNEIAKERVPRLWASLDDEPDAKERRRQVENAAVEFWSVEWVRKCLPDEAKQETRAHGQKARKAEVPNKEELLVVSAESESINTTHKGDAGNHPELLRKYVVDDSEDQLVREAQQKDAKIRELQAMVKVLSVVPNAGKLADLEQQIAGLKYENEQLAQGLEGKPLVSAKEDLASTTILEVPLEAIAQIIIACQKAGRENKGFKVSVKDGKIVGVSA